MSFGFGVGDFIAVGGLCWKVYKKCKDSSGNYAELSGEVSALYTVIKETEELLSQQGLTQEQQAKLDTCRQGCEAVLKNLDGLLIKYESLGTKSQRTFDRIGLGNEDINGIRLRLISNVSMLDAFNNTSSHARLEKKLNLLISEIRAGKREGSIVSTKTFDTAARNDRETWEALRRELEDIGISPGVITEKRHFIIAWFQEAVTAGKLEEDVPSDDGNSVVASYESDNPADESDGASITDREMSSMVISQDTSEQSTRKEPDREMPSMAIAKRTSERNTTKEPIPKARRNSGQPAGLVHPRPQQEGEKSRLRVSYLINKLRDRDKQFLKAVEGGDITMIKKTLEKGAHVSASDRYGGTALERAAKSNNKRIVQLLLDNGVDVNAQNAQGETALRCVPFHGRKDGDIAVVRLLLENGADIESKSLNGFTALLSASLYGKEEIVLLLLEKGADIESKSPDGVTALIYAAQYGNEETVRLLLEKGADIESKTSDGFTALLSASKEEIVRLLLEKGADIESKTSDGLTALTYASQYRNEEIVRLLLEKGADIESKSWNGSTALMYASQCFRNEKVVRLLLDKGAKIDTENKRGETALFWAKRGRNEGIVRLLRRAGARAE
ncbi:hypothetical protein MMC28_005361 [Mycoblastus sanguinarius]|nr:hypothetical protein [Mycoblastus sanguinarius]